MKYLFTLGLFAFLVNSSLGAPSFVRCNGSYNDKAHFEEGPARIVDLDVVLAEAPKSETAVVRIQKFSKGTLIFENMASLKNTSKKPNETELVGADGGTSIKMSYSQIDSTGRSGTLTNPPGIRNIELSLGDIGTIKLACRNL